MAISKAEVQHVARLARLTLDETALDAMAEQVSTILAYMETLNQIDTSDVEPTSHAVSAAATPVREDAVHEHSNREQALENAPAKDGQSFLVPRVIG
jgi:aspartyl-tRNA(Asn)/glutamyl-tRNA(Gln) amidotransferase subunit C